MESYGLGMDDLFDDGDVEQELENFEAVEEGADDNLNQESADIDGNSQDENGKFVISQYYCKADIL